MPCKCMDQYHGIVSQFSQSLCFIMAPILYDAACL